jgi:beta-phosphoglucomutase-like phosphatase (HAD superfamily)
MSPSSDSFRAKAVVFDLDGLMFNTEELYQLVGTEVLRRRGKSFDAELLHSIMGRPGPVALQMMIDYHRLDATVEQLAAENDEIFGDLLDTQLAYMPGLDPLLTSLEAARIPKAIATSSGVRFVTNVLSSTFALFASVASLLSSTASLAQDDGRVIKPTTFQGGSP